MYSNISEDPNLTLNVRHSEGVREDRRQRVERQVNFQESEDTFTDHHVQVSTQEDGGTCTQKHLSAVQRKSFRAAALTGSVVVLLVVGVIVLFKLYISIIAEKQQLSNKLQEQQTRYEKLQTSFRELQTSCGCQLQGEETPKNNTEWKRFRCSCYYKSTEMKNWTESRRDCQTRGADLVIINNKEEQDFVAKLDEHGTSWIGLLSEKTNQWKPELKWKWVDGSKPIYLAWRRQVNSNPVDGSTAYIDPQGTWNHINNGLKKWICEKEMK